LVGAHENTVFARVSLLADTVFARISHSVSLSAGGCLVALMRWPWMAECPCSQDWNTMFQIRAPPRMARRRDGEKGPSRKYANEVYTFWL